MLGFSPLDAADTTTLSTTNLGLGTPIPYDPQVLVDLRSRWRQLRVTLRDLALSRQRGDASAAALAAQSCSRQLHDLQCQEALRVFPLVARHLSNDAPALDRLLQERLELYRMGRRLLRLLEDLPTTSDHASDDRDIALVWDVLESCVEVRQQFLYRLYEAIRSPAPLRA